MYTIDRVNKCNIQHIMLSVLHTCRSCDQIVIKTFPGSMHVLTLSVLLQTTMAASNLLCYILSKIHVYTFSGLCSYSCIKTWRFCMIQLDVESIL